MHMKVNQVRRQSLVALVSGSTIKRIVYFRVLNKVTEKRVNARASTANTMFSATQDTMVSLLSADIVRVRAVISTCTHDKERLYTSFGQGKNLD